LDGGTPDAGPPATGVTVTLTRASGVTGVKRINVALPLPPGTRTADPTPAARVNGAVVPTGSRVLARYRDGQARSVQVQFDAPDGVTTADLELDGSAPALALVAVDTLLRADTVGASAVRTPEVWVTLPPSFLVQSQVAGHLVEHAALTTAPLNAWRLNCDYQAYGTAAFAAAQGTQGTWLYDRGTVLYRGYAQTGDVSVLQAAWRETDLYRQSILAMTLPGSANNDLKYNYTQAMAIHYLLTGDDRFREAAETVAQRSVIAGYTGAISGSFWTERHAGFGLLANVYAARVSDDLAATFENRARVIVDNLVAIQETNVDLSAAPAAKQLDAQHRCFAHTPEAHDISEYVDLDSAQPATLVCSPWMSAIVADGLEAYADDADATQRTRALNAVVRLGRRLGAVDNRGADGRPHYLLGVDGANAPDAYHEHWGEVAQVVAMAYHYSGRTDDALRTRAMHHVDGFATLGTIGQIRSFNWQCRSGVATPFYLR